MVPKKFSPNFTLLPGHQRLDYLLSNPSLVVGIFNFLIGDVEREKQKVKDFLFPSRGVKKGAIPDPAKAGLHV